MTPRYKKREIEYLSDVDRVTLARFRELDQETQQHIIDGLWEIANNGRVGKQDREIAAARATQFEQAANPPK